MMAIGTYESQKNVAIAISRVSSNVNCMIFII